MGIKQRTVRGRRNKLARLFGPRSGLQLQQKPGCLINLEEDSRAESI